MDCSKRVTVGCWEHRVLGTFDCWANNPAGTATITIIAFVLAVVGQLVQGFVDWRYFKDLEKGPALRTAGSVFEAAGVLAVSITLINLPSFGEMGEVHIRTLHSDQKALFRLAVTGAVFAALGALAEIMSGYLNALDRDSRSSWGTRRCRMFVIAGPASTAFTTLAPLAAQQSGLGRR